MAHECPDCGQYCYCDQDDTFNSFSEDDCVCQCWTRGDDDDDDDDEGNWESYEDCCEDNG